jgi:hypothetical protein
MDNHVQHFYKTGKLLDGTYYFDPPLIEPEIKALYDILPKVKNSKLILNPLKRNLQYADKFNEERTIIYLEFNNNSIAGWQNIYEVEDEDGKYILHDLNTLKRWMKNGYCRGPLRNGRLFVGELPNTEDIFNQLNESDEFDWLPEFNLKTIVDKDLVDFLNQYFKDAGYAYQAFYEALQFQQGEVYGIRDETGRYVTINPNIGFSLASLENNILRSISITRMKARLGEDYDETIQEYQELYQALTPLFKMT